VRITYDTEVDALTIVVTRDDVARTVDAGKGRLIDLDEHDNIVAMELLDISHGVEFGDLVSQYDDMLPVLEQLVEYARTGQHLFRDDSDLATIVGDQSRSSGSSAAVSPIPPS